MRRAVCLAALLALTWADTARAYGSFEMVASNPDTTTIAIDIYFTEDPTNAAGHPEWTGFDLYRSDAEVCGPYVRVNDQPFPRSPGQSYHYTFVDHPSPRTLYQYRAQFVDSNRNILGSLGFFEPNLHDTWDCAPANSAPMEIGAVEDWGWTLNIIGACPGTCRPSAYLVGQPPEMRNFVGTDTVVRVFGSIGCNTVEGCAIIVDHFDTLGCDIVVPVRPTTWGRLHAIYR